MEGKEIDRHCAEEPDMICFNQECINGKRQLFRYIRDKDKHAEHLFQKCISLHVHPLNKLEMYQNKLLKQVEERIHTESIKYIQRLVTGLKDRLVQAYKDYSSKLFDEFKSNNQQLLNNQMIANLKSNINSEEKIGLLNALYFKKPANILKIVINYQSILSIQRFKLQAKNLIESIQNNFLQKVQKKPIIQCKPNSNQINAHQIIEEYINQQYQISSQLPSQCSQSHSQVVSKKNILQQKNVKEQNIQTPKKLNKSRLSKTIKKYARRLKSNKTCSQKQKQSKCGHLLQKYSEESESDVQIIEISDSPVHHNIQRHKQIQIRTEEDIQYIFKLKQGQYFDKLIFFCNINWQKFVKIINTLKPTQIMLNQSIFLGKTFMWKINSRVLQRLQIFQQHWNHNQHFVQMAECKHFPIRDFIYKKPKKLHFSYRFWRKLAAIKNVWISNKDDLTQLKKSQNKVYSIQYLRIQPPPDSTVVDSFFGHTLDYFKKFRSIKTLIIKRCSFDSINVRLLKELVNNNRQLQCVFLQNNKNITICYLSFLKDVKLKKLAVINEKYSKHYIDCSTIFQMKSLQYLYLNNVNLTRGTVKTDSDDAKDIKTIYNLQNLVFLDLYSSIICPTFIQNLHPKVYANLKYLNIGYLNDLINEIFIPQLTSFKSLEYLALDGTAINLQMLFRNHQIKYRLGKTLKWLSLRWFVGNLEQNQQSQQHRLVQQSQQINNIYYPLTQEIFQTLAKALPNLEYLNITDSFDVISTANIIKLGSLKNIAVDHRYINADFLDKMALMKIAVCKVQSKIKNS